MGMKLFSLLSEELDPIELQSIDGFPQDRVLVIGLPDFPEVTVLDGRVHKMVVNEPQTIVESWYGQELVLAIEDVWDQGIRQKALGYVFDARAFKSSPELIEIAVRIGHDVLVVTPAGFSWDDEAFTTWFDKLKEEVK